MIARFGPPARRLATRARPLQPFLVERYPGWSESGVLSITSSECEPLQMRDLLSLADEEQLTTYESVLAALEDGWHPLLRDDACGTSAAPAEPDDIAMGIDHLLDIFREEDDERSRRADARMIELEKRVDRLERRLESLRRASRSRRHVEFRKEP